LVIYREFRRKSMVFQALEYHRSPLFFQCLKSPKIILRCLLCQRKCQSEFGVYLPEADR